MASAWRARWQRWWQARHPRSPSTLLTQRNVYILPTSAGWLYAALLVALLLGSINYQLNLGYLLTFLLAGSGVVALHATHATIRGLQITAAGATLRQGHAGDVLELPLRLTDPQPRGALARAFFLGRHGIALRWTRPDLAIASGHAEPLAIDGPEQGEREAAPAWTPLRRGPQPWPTLHIEARYPLGLLRAWSLWRPTGELLVWPTPEADPPPLPVLGDEVGEPLAAPDEAASPRPTPPWQRRATELPEPDGVRPWRDGDRPSQVLWRRSARLLDHGGELLVRDLQPPPPQGRVLAWRQTADLGDDREARLSRLCAWVLQAERAGLRWALVLPGLRLPEAEGPAHRLACLDALARAFPTDPGAAP
ncbi:DUF58 domain-containing protein [Leptothrix discophora]|uniref:DUF58 domain-containing protein n=1 Tax=Leptothrix discophora TaxID=89 RepID=A0ABT9G0Y7_LEPDI|nr:DUF58 domain-containing protein [Leptothrix discophora]MDP4300090.1 DUF58 domain-containing protein [Leptothrix discophora]